MIQYYSDEKNVQILVALLKEHGINKIIASPGSANSSFVASLQSDNFFDIYSAVDERSAAYMACGLSAELGAPVVITCTGATASRNYMPALTEAYYRKLPILAITATRIVSKIGHLHDQVLDRSVMPNDVTKISVTLPVVSTNEEKWDCEIKINQAILELTRNGGGPAHINLPTNYIGTFTTAELPTVNAIKRITSIDTLPKIPEGKVAIFIGSHILFSQQETQAIDDFCNTNNAVVLCDHTSSYKGKFRIQSPIVMSQLQLDKSHLIPDTLIHIGEVSGFQGGFFKKPKQVWRVSEDGEIRDTFQKLKYVFEMPLQAFFKHYTSSETNNNDSYLQRWNNQIKDLNNKIPELPFSNVWVAQQLANKIPENSVIHFAILNSLTSWNYFEISNSVTSFSNVGGFGIDGCVSTLLGASLANTKKLHFGIIGDLAFFYDLNAIGNRHLPNNLRILLINNGMGVEFKIKGNQTAQHGTDTNEYIAAAGHFGNKSPEIVKSYATNFGFNYLTASNKEEFDKTYSNFVTPELSEKPILFEVFTNDFDEKEAHEIMFNIEKTLKGNTKDIAKKVLGEKGFQALKRVIKK